MAFRLHIPKDMPTGDPVVSVRPSGAFSFSSEAVKTAALHESIHWVKIHLDSNERCVAFEFLGGTDRPEHSYKLRAPKRSSGGTRNTRICTAKALIRNTPWIRAVANLENVADRKCKLFRPPAEPNFWAIRLMPWFELSVEPDEIATVNNAAGIYRYRDADGAVIYIGKGIIADRFRSPERRDWGIATVEYSKVDGEGRQYEVESFHIKRFASSNNGRLPHFNRDRGRG